VAASSTSSEVDVGWQVNTDLSFGCITRIIVQGVCLLLEGQRCERQ
jgi:hypothetical protein